MYEKECARKLNAKSERIEDEELKLKNKEKIAQDLQICVIDNNIKY